MELQWISRKNLDINRIKEFSEKLQVPEIVAIILLNRGIETYNDAFSFLKPSISSLHNPFLMKGMETAVERIINAVKRNEKIMIFGDYDVDGVTATAVLYMFLKKMGS